LLDRRLDDLLRGLVQPGVDDLVPGVPQGPGDHLGAAVVAVESRLGHHDADRSNHHPHLRGASRRSGQGPREEPPVVRTLADDPGWRSCSPYGAGEIRHSLKAWNVGSPAWDPPAM